MGAWNRAPSSWENKDLDVWILRSTANSALKSKKMIGPNPMAVYTRTRFNVLTLGF